MEKNTWKLQKNPGNIPAKGKSEGNGIPFIFAESQTRCTAALSYMGLFTWNRNVWKPVEECHTNAMKYLLPVPLWSFYAKPTGLYRGKWEQFA